MIPRAIVGWLALTVASCAEPAREHPLEVDAYLHDIAHRRDALERDLVSTDNAYARLRLDAYAVDGGWDALPERDPPSHGLSEAAATATLGIDPARTEVFTSEVLPQVHADWIELGRRVWFGYPFTASSALEATALAGRLRQRGCSGGRASSWA